MKMLVRKIFLLFFLSTSISLFAMQPQNKPEPLNIAMFFDDGSELENIMRAIETKNHNPFPITGYTFIAIKQKVPFVITRTLFSGAKLLAEHYGNNSEYKNLFESLVAWNLFITPEKEFIIAFPPGYPTNAQEIVADRIKPLSFENLKSLEIDTSLGISLISDGIPFFKNNLALPVRILLGGHGSAIKNPEQLKLPLDNKITEKSSYIPEAKIANLTHEQYTAFLKYLNSLWCDFLMIFSCYSGGLNAIAMHSEVIEQDTKHMFQKIYTQFPIAVSSLTDTVSIGNPDVDIAEFFNGLNDFFNQSSRESSTNIPHWTITPFKELLKNISGTKEILNTTSIRFPGENQFFKVVTVDNSVLPLTTAWLLSRELKFNTLLNDILKTLQGNPHFSTLSKREFIQLLADKTKLTSYLNNISDNITQKNSKKLFELGIKTLEILRHVNIQDKQLLIIYPSIITAHLLFNRQMPIITSGIPGPAYHYLEKVTLRYSSPEKFLRHFYKDIVNKLSHKKIFFIKNLALFDDVYNDVVIVVKPGMPTHMYAIANSAWFSLNTHNKKDDDLPKHILEDLINDINNDFLFEEAYLDATRNIDDGRKAKELILKNLQHMFTSVPESSDANTPKLIPIIKQK